MNASSFDFETGRGLEASRECGEAVVGRGNAEASVGVSAPTRESSGRPWPPGDPRGDARVRPRSHERVASHRARPSIPRPKKTSGKTGERGPICQGPAPCGARSHLSTSVVPFRTLPMAWCSSCLSNADVPLDDIVLPRARRRPRAPLSNQKKSLRPFAQLKFRSPRPDRRARSCRDASVSVDPPRVRLLVNEIEMSAAERLGMFTSSGAHYPAKPECPHAAGRTNAGKNKSSQCARVIYLLRQTPLADPASCIFARGEASRWLTSALTRRVPSHVPSSPSLHGAPHSVRGCLIVARRGQQSLAIQSKANGKAGAGAVRNRLFRLEIRTRSSQGISVRRDRIVHQPLKNAGKVHRENGNPKKRGFKAAKKDLLPKNDSLKELLSASAKIPVWRGNNFFGGCNFTFTLKA